MTAVAEIAPPNTQSTEGAEDTITPEDTVVQFVEGSQEYKGFIEVKEKLKEALRGTEELFVDDETGERVVIGVNDIFIDQDSKELSVPVDYFSKDGAHTKGVDMGVDDALRFIATLKDRLQERAGKKEENMQQNTGQQRIGRDEKVLLGHDGDVPGAMEALDGEMSHSKELTEGNRQTGDAANARRPTRQTRTDAPVMRDEAQASDGLLHDEIQTTKRDFRFKRYVEEQKDKAQGSKAKNDNSSSHSARLGLTKDERAGQRDVALRDIRARLSRALEGHRGDLTDPQTRQRITIDMNSIRPREGTHNQDGMPIFEVPVVLRDAQGRVAKEKYLTVDEAEDFINYALYTQQKHKEMVEPDDRNGAELSGADYSKIAKTVLEDARSVDKDYANNNSLKRVPEENKQQSVDGARQEQQQETVASEENMEKPEKESAEKPEEIWKSAQEKLARKKEAVRTAERAVVDMAQEIGQLREEIAQTEGSLAEHEETISALMAKLDVARDSFGNYGEETEMLRRKLDSLKENLQRLQVRVQAEKAPDAEAAAQRAAEEAELEAEIAAEEAELKAELEAEAAEAEPEALPERPEGPLEPALPWWVIVQPEQGL